VAEPHFERRDDAYIRPTEDPNAIQAFLSAQSGAKPGDEAPRLWTSVEQREQWYERGKAYWEWDGLHNRGTTNDGVMSGIGPLHDADIADSFRFLVGGESSLWPQPAFQASSRALDLGAGIGRVSGALLFRLCGEVDLVDGSATHLETARATLGEDPRKSQPVGFLARGEEGRSRGRLGRCICCDLQDYVPPASTKYDLVWIQWTTMYLTDNDLIRLLRDCRGALAPGGMIVLKDNVIDVVIGPKGLIDGRYMVDEEDASVSRTRSHLLDLVREAGLRVVASTTSDFQSEAMSDCLSQNGWQEMHPVAMLALRSAEGGE